MFLRSELFKHRGAAAPAADGDLGNQPPSRVRESLAGGAGGGIAEAGLGLPLRIGIAKAESRMAGESRGGEFAQVRNIRRRRGISLERCALCVPVPACAK